MKDRRIIMSSNLHTKISTAAKWSAIGEVMAKLITPISTVVLARLLTPEAFGVIATISMVISFAEIFMDAGFQRYIIQREYNSDQEKFRCADVAFWTNLTLGVVLWGVIFIFKDKLANLVGNPGLGIVLAIAAISIPISSITSIQMAIFKHSLDFKSLFYRRIATVIVPLAITIPLAFYLRSYWALVIGTLVSNIITAIILTIFSPWRPSLFYDFTILRGMVGYSSWTFIDAILVWATSYAEIFFIGILLNEYYLGLYKTSMTTVGQFVSLISSIILPVLMPALARTQNDYAEMRFIILKLQKYAGLILLPIGALIWGFNEQITSILLGEKWAPAAKFIGIWAIAEVVMLLFSRFCSNIYPAIGKPRVSVTVQILHLIVLIPSVYIAATISFEALYLTRTIIRLQLLIINWWFAHKLIGVSVPQTIYNVAPSILMSIFIGIIAFLLTRVSSNNLMILVWGPLCCLIYVIGLFSIPSERKYIKHLKSLLLKFPL